MAAALAFAESFRERCDILSKILPIHESECLKVLELFPGKPVSFRLFDRPVPALLSKGLCTLLAELKEGHALWDADGAEREWITAEVESTLREVATILELSTSALRERLKQYAKGRDINASHLSGFCGARVAIVYPELVAMQTKAILGKRNTCLQTTLYFLMLCRGCYHDGKKRFVRFNRDIDSNDCLRSRD